MTDYTNQKHEREFYIDWLRILLIIRVSIFQIRMKFNIRDWRVKDDQLYGLMIICPMILCHEKLNKE